MSERKRTLVTGGAGFIGSHLCDYLLEAGHEVLCADNLASGSEANISHLRGHPRFEFRRHDVTAPLEAEADEIYNLACPASPLHYQRDPVQTTKTSIFGAVNLLELAASLGATILQASTSEVYGDPSEQPQSETYRGNVNAIGPRACYNEGKRCAETLFFDYCRQYGASIKVARIFNCYGPRMLPDDGRVVSAFVTRALAGKEITVFGDGTQTRSFCYVDDVVRGLVALMESRRGFAGPVNIGNPEEVSIGELAERVIRITGSRSRISHAALPEDDPRSRRPDIALAASELGWRPAVMLDEGLPRVVAFFRGELPGEARAAP